MAGLLKRVASVVFVIMFMYAPAFAAPPASPDIPEGLLKESKLLRTYVNQMFQRAKYWRGDICQASSVDDIFGVRENLVKDYNLYKATSYQKEYAKICEALFLPILRGKLDLVKADDPLATVKLINIALVLSSMDPAYTEKGFEEMLANQNQAIRFLGWQGMKRNRGANISGSQLKTIYTAANETLSKETNPTIIAEALRAIDFGTAATQTVLEKNRKFAAQKTVELINQNWKKFVENVPSANSGDKLTLPEVAAVTLANNAAFTGNDKLKADAVKLIYAQAQEAVARFEKLQTSIKSVKAGLEKFKVKPATAQTTGASAEAVQPGTTEPKVVTQEEQKLNQQLAELETLAGDYKVFLMNCEEAFNVLAGTTNEFIAKQMTATADPAAAMKMGLLDWQAALKLDAK